MSQTVWDEVVAVEGAYDRAWGSGDLDALLGCLTEDVVLVSPRGDVARSRLIHGSSNVSSLQHLWSTGVRRSARRSTISIWRGPVGNRVALQWHVGARRSMPS